MATDLGAFPERTLDAALDRSAEARRHDVGRLLVTCPDRPGVVAAVSGLLYESGANIIESQQYSTDPFGGTFFLRVEFHRERLPELIVDISGGLGGLTDSLNLQWQVNEASRPKRVAIFASRADHALQELLWRNHSGELDADIRMVVSNHPDLARAVEPFGIPYHHVPVPPAETDPAGRRAAEAHQLELLA
ncbi:MAG: ACT domain-containing protein, partial [Frankia sp.]